MPKKQTSKNTKTHFGLARCPYCDGKVSYFTSFFNRDKGEYTCEKCGETSNIYFVKKINIAVISVSLLSILIFVLYFFFGDKSSTLGILLVFIPFVLFFASTPLFFRLSPMKERSNTKKKTINSQSKGNTGQIKKSQPQSKRHIIINEEKPKTYPREERKPVSEEDDFFANYERRAEQRRKLAAERERLSQRDYDYKYQKGRYSENDVQTRKSRDTLSEYEGATRIRKAVTSQDIKDYEIQRETDYERKKSRQDILAEYEMEADRIEQKSDYERTAQRRQMAEKYQRAAQRRDTADERERAAQRRRTAEEFDNYSDRREKINNYNRSSSYYDDYETKTTPYGRKYESSVTDKNEDDVRVYSPEKRRTSSGEMRQKEKQLTLEQRRAMAQRQARMQAQQRKQSSINYNRLKIDDFDDDD